MCSSKTPKAQKADPHFLQNQYLDGTNGATGLAIGRKQLRTNFNPSVNTPSVSIPSNFNPTMPSIGSGAQRV